MSGLTWLHLSDWHQAERKFNRKVVCDKLIKDIKARRDINPNLSKIDFVVFSGDAANSGQPDEYKKATEDLFKPLLEACQLERDRLFIVPGNHDLDRDQIPVSLSKILNTNEEVEACWNDEKKRRLISQPFQAFHRFLTECTGQKPPEYCSVAPLEIDGRKIALLGINSAWMSARHKDENGEINDQGYLCIGEPQIYESLKEIYDSDIKIAVLHHSLDWLTPFDLSRNKVHLKRKCNFILHGHAHKPGASAIRDNFGYYITIPAGACYDRSMSSSSDYTYSYNYVHLDFETDRGLVILRRWSERNREWRKDDETYPPNGQFPFSISGSDKPSIPHQIPPPQRDFKGRDGEIRDILSSFEKGATITGLRGMGGIGKTALALVLAEKIKDQFPDGQIFVDMRGTSNKPDLPSLTPEDAMAQIIRAFNPADRLPENSGELRGLYHSILDGKRVLLLLDNAAGGAQVEPLLLPSGCAVLITSRIKFALPGLAEKDLDILPLNKSCELLLQIAPRIGGRAEELAKICGCLPLALRNAASALAEKRDLGVVDYERRLKDKVALLELVKGSFSLSYDLLAPLRKKNWRRLSVFPDDFDRKAATAIFKMSPEASEEALSDLVRWSLVDFIEAPDSEEGRYRLHDLARLFAESCLEQKELVDAQQRHANYYSKVISQTEKLYKNGGTYLLEGLKLFDRELSNIKVGQAWVKNTIQGPFKLKKNDLKSSLQLASSYANDGGSVLDLRLHPLDKIAWLDAGLRAAKIMGDKSAEGAHLGNLGNAYAGLGETRKAVGYLHQSLKIIRNIGDRKAEGAILGNLGSRFTELGETHKAIEYHRLALTIAIEIGERKSEEVCMGNLGNAYSDMGDIHKAIEYQEQALAISREIGEKRDESRHLGNLGQAYEGLDETCKAIECYNQALAIAKEIGDKRGEGANLGNLGNAHADLDETHKAIEYYNQALAIAKEIGDLRNEGIWIGNLGSIYVEMGKTRKAIEYYNRALAIAKEVSDRRNEGSWIASLGNVYAEMGETSKAIEYNNHALAIAKEVGDKKSEGVIQGNLGLDYLDLGETLKSIKYQEQSLANAREIDNRRGEGARLGNLGLAYADLGETQKAIEFYEQSLAIANEIGDKKNEAECLCDLGKAYLDLKEPEKAIDFCTQSLSIARKIEYRKFEAEALATLGRAYIALGQLDKALDHIDQALEIFKAIEFRRGEGEALFARSQALDRLDRRAEAEAQASEALQIFEQIESPLAEKVRLQLAAWQSPKEES